MYTVFWEQPLTGSNLEGLSLVGLSCSTGEPESALSSQVQRIACCPHAMPLFYSSQAQKNGFGVLESTFESS